MTLLSVVSISLPMLLYMQCTAVTKCSLTKRFFLCIFSAKAKGEIQALKTLRKQAFSNAARAGQPGPSPRCPARSWSHGRGEHSDGAHPPSMVEPRVPPGPGTARHRRHRSQLLCARRAGQGRGQLSQPGCRCTSLSHAVNPRASCSPGRRARAGCGLCSAPVSHTRRAATLACMCQTCEWNDVQASLMLWLLLLETE